MNSPSRRLVVSTIGASLLYNHLDLKKEKRETLNILANKQKLSSEEDKIVVSLKDRAEHTLTSGDIKLIRRKSAELNSIYALYENQMKGHDQDIHLLIVTDTFLGQVCADLVVNHLRSLNVNAESQPIQGLNTASTKDFETGCKNLIHWCADFIPGYRENYVVTFNLVAAFKSLQGYLNTIGMFYADEILYLFEGEDSQPVFIPRLPIKVDLSALRPFAVPLAMMAEAEEMISVEHIQRLEQNQTLSSTLYDSDGQCVMISNWGELVWKQVRDEILGGELLDFPRLFYKPDFEKEFRKTRNSKDKVQLQSTLAKVAVLLEEDNGSTARLKQHGGLQYDDYTNQKEDGQPIGHFRVDQGTRVSCIAKDSGLILRRFGPEPDVNRRP